MSKEEKIHQIWLKCMQMSNCTVEEAHKFLNAAEPFLQEAITPIGQNILIVAASIGAECIVEECLKKKVDPNFADSVGRTGLHYAASIGSLSIFESLVKSGADPLKETIGGETPLTKACIFCQGEIIEWYLNNEIQAFDVGDRIGKKPLEMLKLEG